MTPVLRLGDRVEVVGAYTVLATRVVVVNGGGKFGVVAAVDQPGNSPVQVDLDHPGAKCFRVATRYANVRKVEE